MITLTDFTAINDEIKSAINSTLDEIKNSSQMNYVLYLANGDYRNEHDNPNSTLNPNVIDYQGDLHRDETRLNFLGNFLKTFYSFPKVKLTCWGKLLSIFNSSLRKNISEDRRVDDDELRISLELMVYSHTWESDNFLKDLYRLAKLVDIGIYEWNVVVPPMAQTYYYDEVKTFYEDGYTYQCDVPSHGLVSLYNKDNQFIHVDRVYKDSGKRHFMSPSSPRVIEMNLKREPLLDSIINNSFSVAEKKRLKGNEVIISMFVSSETGKVMDVEFNFHKKNPYATIPISRYRDIELKIKKYIHFTPTEEGKKLNYIFYWWGKELK